MKFFPHKHEPLSSNTYIDARPTCTCSHSAGQTETSSGEKATRGRTCKPTESASSRFSKRISNKGESDWEIHQTLFFNLHTYVHMHINKQTHKMLKKKSFLVREFYILLGIEVASKCTGDV